MGTKLISARDARRIIDGSSYYNHWLKFVNDKIQNAIKNNESDFDILLFDPKIRKSASPSIRQDLLSLLEKEGYLVEALFCRLKTDWFLRIKF